MPKRTNAFQLLVGQIETTLHGTNASVEEPAMIRDFGSDTDIEVDVLITFDTGGRTYQTVIECRDRKRRQGKDWIRELAQKRLDCRLDCIVAASASGFSKPAYRLAESSHVGTIHVTKASDVDLRKQIIPFERVAFNLVSCKIGDSCQVLPAPPFEFSSTGRPCPRDFQVRLPTGLTMTLAEVFARAQGTIKKHVLEFETPLQPVSSLPEEADRTLQIQLAVVFVAGATLAIPDGRQWEIRQILVPGIVKFWRNYLDGKDYFLYGQKPVVQAHDKILNREVRMTFVGTSKPSITMEGATFGPNEEDANSDFDVHYRTTTPGSEWVRCYQQSV